MARPQSILIQWQCWVTLLQLLPGLMLDVLSLMRVIIVGSAGGSVAPVVMSIILWSTIVANDIFVLTFDFKRTNTYVGCVAAQGGINFCFIGLIVVHIVLAKDPILAALPVIIAGTCSLCLSAISMWPIFAHHSHIPTKSVLLCNTKDAFGGTFSPAGGCTFSMFGHQRGNAISHPIVVLVAPFGRGTKRFTSQLLFRRVRSVESQTYAFIRNFFSVVAMAILLFRTITALLQAQNEFSTRMVSASCDGRTSPSTNIGVLVERVTYDPSWNASSFQAVSPVEDIDILVSASWTHSRRGQEPFGTRNCSIEWSQGLSTWRGYSGPGIGLYQNRTVELYSCPEHWTEGFRNYDKLLQQSSESDVFAYHIEVHPRTLGQQVLGIQMPFIWLVNTREIPSNYSNIDVNDFGVRDYMPPWEMLPGSHIEAEAKLITRRFISSSIMKDVILNSEPLYRSLSLYPIIEASTIALNSSSTSNTTATIHASLTPGLIYLRNEADVRSRPSNVCDFIDDYRSGSVLDIVGSVGGLFALLQAIHLLLFGRPLFWGLTGAKLITPFGLLGKCSSRGFKRRLREEYHTKSPEGSDTVHIVKFLRDFVIEFGPADLDPESHPPRQPVSPPSLSLPRPADAPDTHIPLIRMGSDATVVGQKNHGTDDNLKSSDRT